MKIFVINLDSREDRLRFTENQLRDFEWERFPGINGYNYTTQNFIDNGYMPFLEWQDPLQHRSLTNTDVAAVLSHYKLWEKCSELNENILILEDDNEYNGGLDLDEIDILLEQYDIVYLNHREMFPEFSVDINDKFVRPYYPYWNNAYALSPRLATKIINGGFLNCIVAADEFFPLLSGVNYSETCLGFPEQFYKLQEIYKNLLGTNPIAYKNSIFTQLSRYVFGSDIENGNPITNEEYQKTAHILTVATDSSKLLFLNKSVEHYATYFVNLGESLEWNGGNMAGSGGGHKINLVKKQLKHYHDNDIVLFVDGYDVFFTRTIDEIVSRFVAFDCDVLFAAEISCWPDASIAEQFELDSRYNYLNSGLYIGYVKHLKQIMTKEIEDFEDDQLYLQKRYLENKSDPNGVNILLDKESYVFQCLSGVSEDVAITSCGELLNVNTNCCPCLIHGNGGEFDKQYFSHLFHKFFNLY